MVEMVGAVLTPLTVNKNGELAVEPPSFTDTVIVAVPVWPVAGVTVTVRLLPLPLKTILALGTRAVLDELPARVRLAIGVSASLIVNGMAAVGVLTVVVWLAMALMVGAAPPTAETVVSVRVQPPAKLP